MDVCYTTIIQIMFSYDLDLYVQIEGQNHSGKVSAYKIRIDIQQQNDSNKSPSSTNGDFSERKTACKIDI